MSTQIPRVHTSADSLWRMANKHGNRSSAFQSRHRPFSSRFAIRRSAGRRKYASRARRGRLCRGVGGDEGEGGVEIAMGVVRPVARSFVDSGRLFGK